MTGLPQKPSFLSSPGTPPSELTQSASAPVGGGGGNAALSLSTQLQVPTCHLRLIPHAV
jgi:hypothetical protein